MYRLLEAVLLVSCLSGVDAHGRLVKPPARGTMWRYGFDTPKNYNDNELSCGGTSVQWDLNGGKCGVCGDRYDDPSRPHEAGGKYASNVTAGYYTKGSTIEVSVEITANHKGWFEFRVCKNDNFSKKFLHDCLNKHVLSLAASPYNTRHYIDYNNGLKNFILRLPENLTCTQCVLQWKYNTGNSWGTDKDGKGCLGCGEQEQFYGCSDIAISEPVTSSIKTPPLSTTSIPTTVQSTTSTSSTSGKTILSTILRSSTATSKTSPIKTTSMVTTTTSMPTTTAEKITTSSAVEDTSPCRTTVTPGESICKGVAPYANDEMDKWCEANCKHNPPYCPKSHCHCS